MNYCDFVLHDTAATRCYLPVMLLANYSKFDMEAVQTTTSRTYNIRTIEFVAGEMKAARIHLDRHI